MNIPRAVRFIEANGNVIENYRLRFLLDKERIDEIPLQHLGSLQNRDGGFPYNDEKGKASCVSATDNNIGLMIELGLGKSDVCKKAVDYLFEIQGKDGSWSESDAIKQYNPPFWDLPGNASTSMWLTASIVSHLIQLGFGDSPAVQEAAAVLLKNRDKDGKFAGFLHSTWIAVGVFGQLEGSNSSTVKKALKVMKQNFEKIKDSAGDLAWCLECFYVAGISKGNPLVKRCIEELTNLQQKNGTWKSGDGEAFTVSTTINVLKVLKKYKVW